MGRNGGDVPEASVTSARGPRIVGEAAAAPVALQAVTIFVAAVSQYLLMFVVNALSSRALGAEGRGIYYAPLLGAMTVLTLSRLGLDQVNVFLLASRSAPLSRLTGQNGFVALWAGLVGCVVTVSLRWALPSVYAGTPALFLLLAGLTIPFAIHGQLSGGLLSMLGRPTWPYRAGVAGAVIQIVLLVGLIASGRALPATVLLVNLVAAVCTWAVVYWPLSRTDAAIYAVDFGFLKETLRSALLLHVGMLLLFLHLRVDLFMVKAWLGTEALGLYSVTVTLGETLPLATESIAMAILPGQVGNTLADAAMRALRASRATIGLGLVFALGWLVLGEPLIRFIFGREFLASYLPLVVLLPGMVLMGVQRTCGAPVLRAGRPGLVAAIYAISLSCNVVLNVLWIPRWGLVGASASSSVSYVICSGLFAAWNARLANIPFHRALLPDRRDWDAVSDGIQHVRRILRTRTQGDSQSY